MEPRGTGAGRGASHPARPRASVLRRGSSIALLLVVIILSLTAGLLGVAGLVGYKWLRSQELSDLEALSGVLADQAVSVLALPVWNMDTEQIGEAARSVMRVGAVRSVEVWNELPRDRLLLLARTSADSLQVVDGGGPQVDEIVREQEIVYAGETIGRIRLAVSLESTRRRLFVVASTMAIGTGLTGLVLSLALYALLWRFVLGPLRVLERFAQGADRGGNDASALKGTVFRGELDSLRLSMLAMVELLEARYRSIQMEARRYSESEARFRVLVDTIPDLVWLKDADGVYLSCNRMFSRFFGAPESEIVGKTDRDFVDADLAEFFRENDRKAMAHGGPLVNEEWVVFADSGERVLLETIKTPMSAPDGRLVGVLGIGRDVTRRHKAEEERRRLDERMGSVQKLEALGVLVAGVAHNINNVLAAILGTVSMRATESVDPADREAFAVVSTACKRGRDVVKSLMQFSRPTLHERAPFEIHGILSELKTLLGNTTRNRVEILEDFFQGPLWVFGDAGGISNVFMNLCINSIDAMPSGGSITLATRLLSGGDVEISVRDTGEGMPPEVLERALEPFFTTKEIGKGTGLGLSMSRGVVKAHGGDMEISSEPGRGTVVRIVLPRIPEPAKIRPAIEGGSGTEKWRILLVDDDPDVRFLVERMLKRDGHSVVSVDGGQAALDQLGRETPDLVVMDQNMPGMDGIKTLERIRQILPTLPVLISSGQPDIQDWPCFRSPNTAVIAKPFDVAELKAKLLEFAGRGESA